MERFAVAGLGLSLFVLLVVARGLEPNAKGHGTHQGLGLPPCTSIVVFGHRCPACGMTTSWANLVRGRVIAAALANVGGMLLCGVSLAAVPWLLVSAARGRWIVWRPNSFVIAVASVAVSAVTLVDWIVRLSSG